MIDRYSRQVLFPGVGREGQQRIGSSCAAVIGCGALGTVVASVLARAGVGELRIIDRDFIEYHNLQRQVLFDEEDVKNRLPKAIAAERHLKKANSSIIIKGIVADVNHANIEGLVSDADVIVDGVDNLETRFLVNDVSMKHGIPWVYGGAIAALGMTMTIIPGETACLRCAFSSPSGQGLAWTCDTAGVIASAPFLIGSLQATEAIKILTGSTAVSHELTMVDVWRTRFDHFKIVRRKDCPACNGKYEFLETRSGTRTASLCGQNAVQVLNSEGKRISFGELADRLKAVGTVTYNEFMLNFEVDSREMVVFPDGRAIVKNTTDESAARALYSKYIGN